MMKKVKSVTEQILFSPLHFLFLSIYFVFRMYSYNVHGIPFREFVRPLIISVFMGLVLYLVFRLMVRKRHAAALMTSTFIVAFYTYGLFWGMVYSANVTRRPEIFAMAWAALFIILITWIRRKTPESPDPNILAGVNLMAVILLLFPTVEFIIYILAAAAPFPSQTNHTLSGNAAPSSPDIYYIILDSYPRADVLAEIYGYDNSTFLQSLKDMGFYVAECSQSNYGNTAQSFTSTLNLDYVQNMSDTFSPDEVELMGLFKLLDNNNVQETVSNFGYKTIAFSSGFLWAEWRDADVYISPPDGPVTEFEIIILFSTYLRVLDDKGIINFDDIHAERFRTRTRLILNSFDDLINIQGPKFVFIHLIVPHSPFAFDAEGNPISPDHADPKYGYLDQVKFINKFILPELKKLIEKSPNPPVIILQGDHGPLLPDNHAAQLKILNAYYLPNGSESLYPSISPVNTFRVLFNEYFGADFPLLGDKSYYSDLSRRYDFTVMPNTCSD